MVPDSARSVEIHSPGRPVMEVSWECTDTCPRMTIEPKNFSSLFRLQFPPSLQVQTRTMPQRFTLSLHPDALRLRM